MGAVGIFGAKHMKASLAIVLTCVFVAGCSRHAQEQLAPITADYRSADSKDFTGDQAWAVAVAKTEFEKRHGSDARYKFTTNAEGFRVFIQPVRAYDHGEALTDPNALCSVLVSTQFTVIRFYGAL